MQTISGSGTQRQQRLKLLNKRFRKLQAQAEEMKQEAYLLMLEEQQHKRQQEEKSLVVTTKPLTSAPLDERSTNLSIAKLDDKGVLIPR